MFSSVYSIILISCKLFIIDNPIITIISAVTTLAFLLAENNLKNLKLNLTYSLFITCITEYVHFLIFKLFSISRETLGIAEVTSDQSKRLLIGTIFVLVLYTFTILLIYMFKKVNIYFIVKLSNYKIFPIFLGIALLIITCLKYCIKYTYSNKLHNILSAVFVGFMVIYFVFLFSSKTFLNIIESLNKEKINPAIKESDLNKGKGLSGLTFISKELNSEMHRFLNMLHEMGMDAEEKKSKQIAYCAVLLNHEKDPHSTNMISLIYPRVANILDRQPKTIESNISNAIKALWDSNNAEILEKIRKNYKKSISPEKGCPQAKEFLLYLTQKYKSKYPKNKFQVDSEYSFFKKYFLNIQN